MPTEKETAIKNRKIGACIAIVALYLIAIGGIFILSIVFEIGIYDDIRSPENLENPDTPYSEIENATYVITPKTYDSFLSESEGILIVSSCAVLIGFAIVGTVLLTIPYLDKTKYHESFCGIYDSKYCPECGVRIREVEIKKLRRDKDT